MRPINFPSQTDIYCGGDSYSISYTLADYSLFLSELLLLSDTLKIQYLLDSTAEFFDSLHAPAILKELEHQNSYVESYNSTVLIQPNSIVGQIHKKSILVPFAERIPYAETFSWLIEPVKMECRHLKLGKGADTVVYHWV